MIILNSDAKVSELIDRDLSWWNISLIHEIFPKEEAELIYGIPICPGSQSDRLVWVGTKNGLFSIKSAYHLAKAICDSGVGDCSSSVTFSQQWKNVWCIKGRQWSRLFLWQACTEILPTRANLFHKHIISSPLCPICEVESETVAHVLWACLAVKDMWIESFKSLHKCFYLNANFADIMELLFNRLEEDQLQLFAVTAHLIWMRRNKWVFDGEFQPLAVVMKLAHEQLNAYKDAELSRQVHLPTTQIPVIQRWTKPPYGVIKLNWNAAVNEERQMIGVGIIGRDHNDHIYLVFTACRRFITDPTSAEAMATWTLADICVKLGFNDAILESDALEVVQALNKEEPSWG